MDSSDEESEEESTLGFLFNDIGMKKMLSMSLKVKDAVTGTAIKGVDAVKKVKEGKIRLNQRATELYKDSAVDWTFFNDRRSNHKPLEIDIAKLEAMTSDLDKIAYLK